MSRQKFYLQQNSALIDKLERAYDFLPMKKETHLTNAAFDRLSLMKTKAIAQNKLRGRKTAELEKSLQNLREAAVKNIDRN